MEIFETRPLWDNPAQKIEAAAAKALWVKSTKKWKICRQRADLRWHRYDPDPEADTLEQILSIAEKRRARMFLRIANSFAPIRPGGCRGRRFVLLLLIFFAMGWNVAPAACASARDKLPLWEIGLGAAALSSPAYRGSQTREFYAVPMPYVVYRGDFLKVDREGIRGRLYDSPRVHVELSAAGATPSSSEEDTVREDMPDLDPVGEVGPSVNYLIRKTPEARIRFRLPLRAVFASDLTYLEHVGWKAHPQLNMDLANIYGQWNLGAVLGPIFADDGYHAYYYGVAPRFATADRAAYTPGSGYSGTSLLLSASRRFANTWVGMYARYDNLAGAAFADSPLVETRHAVSGGIGVAWILGRSADTVPAVP